MCSLVKDKQPNIRLSIFEPCSIGTAEMFRSFRSEQQNMSFNNKRSSANRTNGFEEKLFPASVSVFNLA